MDAKVKTESIIASDTHVNNSSCGRNFKVIEGGDGQIIELRNNNGKISERDFLEAVNIGKRVFINLKSVYIFEHGYCDEFYLWAEKMIKKFNLDAGEDYVLLRFDLKGNLVSENDIAFNMEYWVDFCHLSLFRKYLNYKNIIHTYLVRDNKSGYIKIGRTGRISSRIRSLRSVYKDITIMYLLDKDVEKELHHKYELYRMYGEWFHLDDNQISEIVDLYGFYEFKNNY